jgi:hypothetical protein
MLLVLYFQLNSLADNISDYISRQKYLFFDNILVYYGFLVKYKSDHSCKQLSKREGVELFFTYCLQIIWVTDKI